MLTESARTTLGSFFKLLPLVYLHFDPESLNEHVNGIVVFCREWHNNVGVFHSRLNKVIVSRLHKLAVLGKHVNDSPAPVCDIALYTSGETDVVWSENENFQVHFFSEPLLKNCMNSFKHYYGRCLYCLHDCCSLVSGEIVGWDLAVFPFE